MNRSTASYTALVAAAAGAAAAYFFRAERAAPAREAARERAEDSARWLRERTPDVNAQLARIEDQIDHLGQEMRTRLDALQKQAGGALRVPADPGSDWVASEDLRDLDRR